MDRPLNTDGIQPAGNENGSWIYLVESDPARLTRANRPFQIGLFIGLSLFLTIVCCAWWFGPPGGQRPLQPLLAALWCAGLPICAALCFRVRTVKDNSVWFGRDFVAGSMLGTGRGVAIIRFEDIVRVTLDVSKDRIVGAIIRGKRMSVVLVKWLKDPGLVVRAVFDHAPEHVQWRRSGHPFTRLTRDEVKALIHEAHLPDVDSVLPPGVTYARANDLFSEEPDRKGWFARLFAKGRVRSVTAVSRHHRAGEDRAYRRHMDCGDEE